MTILVIAEHDHATLKTATLNAVTAARQIDDLIHVLIAGCGCGAAAAAAAKVDGVAKVLVADAAHYADQGAENVAALISPIAAAYSHVLAPASSSGKNVMPRVAASLDVAQVSDIVAIEAADTFVRPTYAGNVMTTVKSIDAIKVLTVRTTAFEAASGRGEGAPIEALPPGPDLGLSKVVGREVTKSARPELSAARIVVSGGRGLGSREQFHALLDPLADKLGAALGASRAAVDAGYVPNDYQVGQTGKIVAPQVYFAIGISGAIQHLAGMKDAKVIVAINKDPEAPIFAVADYGLAGDLFEIVPQLVGALR